MRLVARSFEVSFLLVVIIATTASSFGTHHRQSSAPSAATRHRSFTRSSQDPARCSFLLSPRIPPRGGGTSSGSGASSSTGLDMASTSSSSSSASTASASTAVSEDNLALLSDRGRAAIERLVQHDAEDGAQRHVYGDWPLPGTDDEGKKRLAEQVNGFDEPALWSGQHIVVQTYCWHLPRS